MDFSQRHSAIGIEDSGTGLCSILLAGMQPWGISGGNIEQSETRGLCKKYVEDFEILLERIKQRI